MRRHGTIRTGDAVRGQAHENRPAVGGGRTPRDEGAPLQPVDKVGDASGGDQQLLVELLRAELVGCAGPPQRRQDGKAPVVDALAGEVVPEVVLQEAGQTYDATCHGLRRRVEVRPLLPPAVDDPVHQIPLGARRPMAVQLPVLAADLFVPAHEVLPVPPAPESHRPPGRGRRRGRAHFLFRYNIFQCR